MHRMNSFELKEKINEMKQNQIDTDLHGNIEFNDYDSLKRKEFYNNVKKSYDKNEDKKLNEIMSEMEHNINVKNILIDAELYDGELL